METGAHFQKAGNTPREADTAFGRWSDPAKDL